MLHLHNFPPTPGVYVIRCAPTGEEYVGSSKNLKRRVQVHLSSLLRGTNCPPRLLAAWKAHGPSAFRFELVALCALEDRFVQEQAAIDTRHPTMNIYTSLSPKGGNTQMRPGHGAAISLGRYKHTVQGVLGSVASLARHFGVASAALAGSRVADGWDVERAVTTPPLPMQQNPTGLQGVQIMRKADGTPSGRYGARAKGKPKDLWLGTFATAEEAHQAWRNHHGLP